ncbi:MAG: hypothetical protein KC729_06585, partial [Candidatus Eisenbacteria bacterium]|nr:hypothetical protein [Candidatus Eisenbacteria bacterium]
FVDDPLPEGTYRYAVIAEYVWNESELSAEATATIYPYDPPANLAYSAAGDTIGLSWERPAAVVPENPVLLYRLYRAPAGQAFPDTALAEISDTSAVIGYLDAGVPFDSLEYAVTALYAGAESDTSNHVVVPTETWESAPTNLVATVFVDTVSLAWDRPQPLHPDNALLAYRVYRALSEDAFPPTPLVEFSDTSEVVSYLDLEVAPESYHYAVSAVYVSGESGLSGDAPAIIYPIDPPENLTALPGDGDVTLGWGRPQTVDRDNPLISFRIYRAPLGDPFPETPIAEIVDTTAVVSYVDPSVPFADLHYRVTAVYITSESPPSNEAQVLETDWMNPPQSLTAAVLSDSISLSWGRPAPVHPDNALMLYRVYGASSGLPFGAPLAEVTDTSQVISYVDPDVPFADRRYVVTALYAAAESDSSNEAQVSETVWLTEPRNLARTVAADTVTLTWDHPTPLHPDAPPLSFRVYRAEVGQLFGAPLADIPDTVAAASFADAGVPFANHRYVVTTVYAPAESDSSNEVQVLESTWTTPPRDLVASVAVDSVTLAWSAPEPLHPGHLPTVYRLFRAPAGDAFPVDPLAEIPSATDPLEHLDLMVPAGDYDYAITALYPSVESDTSGHTGATIYLRTPPANLVASVDGDVVQLSWDRPDPIDTENPLVSYRVYRALQEDAFGATPIGEFSDTATVVSFDDTGVPFDDWKYRVTGVYANAESAPSNEVPVAQSLWISPPQNLTAQVAADSVLLQWSLPAPTHPDQPPTLYRIFRAPPGQAFPGTPLAEVADTSFSYVDLAVPLADHVYAVTALYATAESDTSNHATVDQTIWSGPARNLAAAVLVDTVQLSWDVPDPLHPSNPPLVYRVFRAPQGQAFPPNPIGTVNGANPPMYTDPGLPVGDYTYAIQVVFAAAESDTSNHADASVYPRNPPQNLVASVASDSISLQWSSPSIVHPDNPVLTYRIYRAKLGEAFGDTPVGEIADTAFVDLAVPFDSLQYVVTALYANTESVASNVEEILESVWTHPATNLTSQVVADTVHLSWARPGPIHPDNDLLLYRVYRAALADTFPGLPLAEVTDPAAIASYADTGVPYGSLKYTVTALYATSAESDTSNHEVVLEEIWNTPPVALSATVVADSVHLQFARPSMVHPANPIQSYRIYRSTWDQPFGAPLDEVADTSEVVLYIDGGCPLDSLQYSVSALYTAGESDTSSHVFIDENIWFTPPQNLIAEAHYDSVLLQWDRPAPIHSANALTLYRVYRAADGEPFGAPIAEVTDSSTVVSFVDTAVPQGTHDYAVSALYVVRESDPSNIVQVEVGTAADAPDLAVPGRLMLRIAPNPFKGEAAVHFAPAGTGALALTIYDVSGARVRELYRSPGGIVEERFVVWDGRDGKGNPVGMGTYFVRLSEGSKATTKRVVLLK